MTNRSRLDLSHKFTGPRAESVAEAQQQGESGARSSGFGFEVGLPENRILKTWHARGFDAITMATRNAAQLIGAKDAWGTLEPGKLANVVAVNGRPDQRIRETRNIELVMYLGKVLEREKLKLNPDTDPGFRPVSPVSSAR